MKKNLLLLGVFCTIISSTILVNSVDALSNSTNIVKIEAKNDYSEYCSSPLLKDLGEINRNDAIIINGVENPLYCTFQDKTDSLNRLQSKVPKILSVIKEKYSLDEINENNWKSYRDGMYVLSDVTDEFSEENEEFNILRIFFGIYEDYEKNQEILNFVSKINSKKKGIRENSDDGIELGMLLPYYAPLADTATTMVATEAMTRAYINVSAAVNYASRYAKSPNKSAYAYFSGKDCANFTSQILEASGVNQVTSDSVYSGWWHKKTKNILGITTHKQSNSWSLADTFSRYMGIGYRTNSHETFSANLQKGDFIASDNDGNGSWDHMGFVTDVGAGICTSTGNFTNYKVAQHSSNYHEWVSSDKNNWENIEKKGGKYARVRR